MLSTPAVFEYTVTFEQWFADTFPEYWEAMNDTLPLCKDWYDVAQAMKFYNSLQVDKWYYFDVELPL